MLQFTAGKDGHRTTGHVLKASGKQTAVQRKRDDFKIRDSSDSSRVGTPKIQNSDSSTNDSREEKMGGGEQRECYKLNCVYPKIFMLKL